MIKTLKRIFVTFIIGLVILLALSIFLSASLGTSVAFQNADGNWADREIPFKNRDFKSMVYFFEIYKIRCNKPNAVLQRTTEKPNIFSIKLWFDGFNAPKWKVPYAEQHPNLKGASFYPPTSMEHCYNEGSKPEEIETAQENARKYISSLSEKHNK